MRLYYDLNIGSFVTSPSFPQALNTFSFKRGDSSTIRLSFCQAGAVVELASGTTGKFGLKVVGNYDGDYIVSDLTWVKTGTGIATIYTFEPNLNTTELNTLLGDDDGGAAADVPSVTLMGEIEWIDGSTISSSATFSALVDNDVNKGDEGLPTTANPGYWNKDESDNRFPALYPALTGGGTALDGVITTTVSVGRVGMAVYSGQLGFWQLQTGTAAESIPGIIHPDDHHPVTNPKIWMQVL